MDYFFYLSPPVLITVTTLICQHSRVETICSIMYLSISSPTPGHPYTPRWEFDINTCLHPWDNWHWHPIFVADTFKGIEWHPLLFDVTIAQYLAKMFCPIPYYRVWGHGGDLTADLAPVVGHLTTIDLSNPLYSWVGGAWNWQYYGLFMLTK